MVSYPLVPGTRAPESFPALCTFYRAALDAAAEAGDEVIWAGDSSGGGLALAVPMYVLSTDPKAPAPAMIFVMSLALDMRCGNPEIHKVDPSDPVLSYDLILHIANEYRGEWAADDPRVSPLLGDLEVLAKRGVLVHGVLGGYDCLTPDGRLLMEKLEGLGVKGKWLVWEKLIHCFPLMSVFLGGFAGSLVPESKEGTDWIVNTLCDDKTR